MLQVTSWESPESFGKREHLRSERLGSQEVCLYVAKVATYVAYLRDPLNWRLAWNPRARGPTQRQHSLALDIMAVSSLAH